jgi:hypothetical protein
VNTYDDLDESIASAADHAIESHLAIVCLTSEHMPRAIVVPDVMLIELFANGTRLRGGPVYREPMVGRYTYSSPPL